MRAGSRFDCTFSFMFSSQLSMLEFCERAHEISSNESMKLKIATLAEISLEDD